MKNVEIDLQLKGVSEINTALEEEKVDLERRSKNNSKLSRGKKR
jgi:hypothetical protein